MLQIFHAVPIRTTVQAATISAINGLRSGTTVALEIDNDFEWLLNGN